jgi:hypothetical protein
MKSDFIAQKDYNLIKFNKEQKDIIKRVKDYSFRNCRTEILQTYITKVLNTFDFGFVYFRTEILIINKSVKNRPCAFACVQDFGNNTLYLSLICAIQNNDDLGTKILNEVILFAEANGYNKIVLECDEKLINFYKKFDFVDEKIVDDDMHYMIKNII